MGKVISKHESKESWRGQNKIHDDKGVSSLRRQNNLKCECPWLQAIKIYGANSDRITLKFQKQPKKNPARANKQSCRIKNEHTKMGFILMH